MRLKNQFSRFLVVFALFALFLFGVSQVVLAQKSGDPQSLTVEEVLDAPATELVIVKDAAEVAPLPPVAGEGAKENKSHPSNMEKKPDHYGDGFENELTIATQDGQRFNFTVELALSPAEQEKGLMFRTSMPENHGMLFVFGAESQRSFWMKDTLIPLDIIFVEKDGRIQHIHGNARPLDRAFITSGMPSLAVLELNGGTAYKHGIKEGDYIYHTAFRNRNRE